MDKRLRQALKKVSDAVTAFSDTTMDYDRLLEAVVRAVADVVPNTCSVTLLSDDKQTSTSIAMHCEDAHVREAFAPLLGRPLPVNQATLQSGAMDRTALVPSLDLDQAAFHPDALGFLRAIGARGMIVVPLRSRGEMLGVLSVIRYDPALPPLDEVDRELCEHLASHAALALGHAKLLKEARELETMRFVDAILENIPNMVFVKEASELRFVRFNRAGEQLLGLPRAQLIGKNDFDFFPTSEAEFFVAKDRETLASGALVDIPEEPIRTATGTRWLHTKKVPIVDEHGVPRFLLGISEDITERKTAIADLAAAKENAEAASRELEAFSYSVAHDLRAPLRGIDGFSQALLDDYADKLDDDGKRHLERIRAAAQRMAALIDDLLDLSRVTRTELRREPVDLTRLVRTVAASLERADPAREVEIVVQDGMQVRGDPKLLAIVLDNLLGNAWKFTSRCATARVDVGSRVEGGECVFFVRDNGAGFDETYRDKLFGVFQRLHTASEYPGTGIGLATVKRIIERHGGRVWAEGAVGKGATFYFTLPEEISA